MKSISIGEVSLQVLDQGAGEPILFIHGFPLNHLMWRGQIEPLSAHFRVIVPDLRGFGQSDVTPGTVNMDTLADDLDSLLTAMHIEEPVNVCGLSMGGYVSFSLWRRYKWRFKRLILCDTRAPGDGPQVAEMRHETAKRVVQDGAVFLLEMMLPKLFASETFRHKPFVVEEVGLMIATCPPEGIAAASRGMAARLDATSILPSITVPTLVLVGEKDQISPPEEMKSLAEAIPGARFRVIEGAGHMAPMENPQAVNKEIMEFLKQ